ncbi:ribonuclease P protein subunit [Candidatus Woesearchaeota archaeon]|nr:ribonuclease P protein subunit [Candidatus Woesearchaeota archaeon]
MKNIIRDELIGSSIEVIDSKNKSNIGLKGKIIDETQKTLVIKAKNTKKRVFKDNITFKIRYKGKELAVRGSLLTGRPKERIKKQP